MVPKITSSSEAAFKCIGGKITLISIISQRTQKTCAYLSKWLEHYRVSNQQKLDCVFNNMARLLSLKASTLHLLALCEWNPPVTGGFSLLRASKSDNSSVPCRHHAVKRIVLNDVVTYPTITCILTNPLTLSQCTLAGPVYTGMPLEYHWLTQCPLECHWRNLVESAPHWDATGETLTFAAYTGTPLEGLWQPTHAPTHIVKYAE